MTTRQEEEEHQTMENELINAILARGPRETDAAEGGVTRKTACAAQNSKGLGRRIGWKEPRRA